MLKLAALCLFIKSILLTINIEVKKTIATVEHIVEESYRLKLHNDTKRKLSKISFKLRDDMFDKLRIIHTSEAARNVTCTSVIDTNGFAINFEEPKLPNEQFMVTIKLYYYELLTFKPNKIGMKEDQKVELADHMMNIEFDEQYSIKTWAAMYVLHNESEKHDKNLVYIYKVSEDGYHEYGMEPYVEDEGSVFENKPISFYFVMNKPFDLFLRTERTVSLSMWGNVKEENRFFAMNQGATLDGEYSNIDFHAGDFATGKNALRWITTRLPADIWGLSIFDEVGNITKPVAYKEKGSIKLNLIPRFSLFGGWKANWFINYNQKSSKFLKESVTDSTLFVFSYPLPYMFDIVLSEEYVIKICLPEYSEVLHVNMNYDYVSSEVVRERGLFELFGKNCHQYTFINYLPDIFKKDFEIVFRYNRFYLWSKLFYLIGIVFIGFMVVFMLLRLDFSFEQTTKAKVKTD